MTDEYEESDVVIIVEMTGEEYDTILKAADIVGQSITEFITKTSVECAELTIKFVRKEEG